MNEQEKTDRVYTTCIICEKEARFLVGGNRWFEPAWGCFFDEMNRPICYKCINAIHEFKKRTEEWIKHNQLY